MSNKNFVKVILGVFLILGGSAAALAAPCVSIANTELKRLGMGTFDEPNSYTEKETLGTTNRSGIFTPDAFVFRSGMKIVRHEEFEDSSFVFATPGLNGYKSAISIQLDKNCRIISASSLYSVDGRVFVDMAKNTVYGFACSSSSSGQLSEDQLQLCSQYKQFMDR